MDRLLVLYRDLLSLKNELIDLVFIFGDSFYDMDAYYDIIDDIDVIEFEIELIELLSSDCIKN